ncbi:hypothetical protein LEN26_001495 [Aphanomyces euteiches]|nr:hypothetical protein AeMF1_014652 [Aphanomyces euteiches]KAH9161280.1 hypothetical protein LEN26_001495 [Aphanomyces euteiches]KAH9184038.1 hypothetical protein AeNC1_013983 [Aphanomyces euteiches]
MKRSKTTQSSTSGVLTSPDLLARILSFQFGVYKDMRAFPKLKLPIVTVPAIVRNTIDQAGINAIKTTLHPWLKTHGIGHLPRLFQCLPHMKSIVVFYAIVVGDCAVLEYMHNQFPKDFPHNTLDLAAWFSQIDVLELATKKNIQGATVSAMNMAALRGKLDVVKWLHRNRSEGCTTTAFDGAATNGHIHVVQWLHANRREGCTTTAMNGAAIHGHLHVVQWLHTHRTEGCTTDAMDSAAQKGNLDMVRWLHFHRAEGCTELALIGAAAGNHLAVVEFLYQQGYTTGRVEAAAMAKKMHNDAVYAYLAAHIARDYSTSVQNFTQMLNDRFH